MLNLHPSMEIVYAVVQPIPQLGALPGDEIIVRPTDPDFPVEVRRTFPLELVAAIPENAIRMLDASPSCAAPAPHAPDRLARATAPVVLRRVG